MKEIPKNKFIQTPIPQTLKIKKEQFIQNIKASKEKILIQKQC